MPPVGLSSSQAAMAALIEKEFLNAGFSPLVAAAAVVNAYAESRLDPKAVGDRSRSVGLFMLNIKGAGAGMSVAARQDPLTNIRTLLAKEKRPLAKVQAQAQQGASLGTLVAAFSTLVERPSDKPGQELERRLFAVRLYPLGVDKPVESMEKSSKAPLQVASAAPSRSKGLVFLVAVSGVVTLGVLIRALMLDRRASVSPQPLQLRSPAR